MFEALEKLQTTNSNKDKVAILKAHDSAELREYLDIALNIYRVYYVSKFPKKKVGNEESTKVPGKGFDKFKCLVKKAEFREISGHLALNTIIEVFSTFTDREKKWFSLALTKKAIGVGPKTVNAAFGKNTIPEFQVMLADNKQPELDKVVYPKLVQSKIDGFRAIFIPGVGFLGRNGKPIRNAKMQEWFAPLYTQNTDLVLDGELDVKEWHGQPNAFNRLASLLNSDSKDKPKDVMVRYSIYDGMSLKEWKQQSCSKSYQERLGDLELFRDMISDYFEKEKTDVDIVGVTMYVCHSPILTLPTKQVITPKQAQEAYDMFLTYGYEGMMVKDPEALYQWKRVTLKSQIMMKMKPHVTEDLKVIGFEEGEGKLKGKVLVDFKGKTVGVGTGFGLKERIDFWKDRSKWLGKTAEVKGMEITPDGSIRHPVFVRWRPDQ